jgi:Zn-dependent protease
MITIQTVYFLVALVIAVTVHEASHAWIAWRLGDPTPRLAGRITLNPLQHLDPLGTIMMIYMAISGFGFGWGKPVSINSYNLRYGPLLGQAVVALGGPAANLVTAAIIAVPLRLLIASQPSMIILTFLAIIVLVNISLAVFNLLPIPPLDGFSVLIGLLYRIPSMTANRLAWSLTNPQIQMYGPFILIAIVLLGPWLLGSIMGPPIRLLFGVLVGRW